MRYTVERLNTRIGKGDNTMKGKSLLIGLVVLSMLVITGDAQIALAKANADAVVEAIDGAALDINSATIEDFQTVKGIGPRLAERIIEYRVENGAFEASEDIMQVRGIGVAKFEKIKQYLKV